VFQFGVKELHGEMARGEVWVWASS